MELSTWKHESTFLCLIFFKILTLTISMFFSQRKPSPQKRAIVSFLCFKSLFSLAVVLLLASLFHMFMKTWAASMTGDFSDKLSFPVYEAANLFPATKIPSDVRATPTFPEQRFPSKRLVFDSSTIASLKTKFRHVAPSKTELVTAIIWKSGLNAARSNSRSSKQSPMSRAVNIRRRISPPLSSNSIGNSVGFDTVVKDESEADVAGLIGDMRKGMKVFDEKVVKMLKTERREEAAIDYMNESMSVRMRDDVDAYMCSSLCNFGWYDVDLGWGRPVRVTVEERDGVD